MFSTQHDTHRTGLLAACPRCGSTECHDNQLPHLSFEEAVTKALMERHEGHSEQAVRTLLNWALVIAANTARAPFTCSFCRVDFQ